MTSSRIHRSPLPTASPAPALTAPTLMLAAALVLLSPRSARAEDAVAYKFQSWQEDAGRIRVDAHYGMVEKNLGSAAKLRLTGVIDSIAGATPTGESAPEGSDQVPLASMVDRREAWQAELSRQFSRINVTAGFASSRESDYISKAASLNTLTDFNQKNTTILVGIARADDDVTARFLPRPREKQTDELIVGVTQLLDPRTSVTVNFTFSKAEGYLSDPYKIISKTVEILPGISLPLTFPENRPEEKDKRILFTTVNRRFERMNAAVEASWRWLNDSFGTTSHTITLEWYQRLGDAFILRPSVRFYEQTEADFYHVTLDGTPITPVAQPTGRAPYYSADYRLAALRTWTYGLKAVWEIKPWLSVDATYERYLMRGRDRSTPASAFADADIFTVGLKLWR
jgi:hypothetical protein